MKIKIQEIQKLLERSASKYVSKTEAGYFAELNIDTHLKKSPRTNPLEEAIKDLENWKEKPNKTVPEILVDNPASLLLNFNGLAPLLKIKYIHDELTKKAKKNGIASLGIKNSGGFHTLNVWTDNLAGKDLIAICMVNGGPPVVVPYGATGTRESSVFGTNPMSYAIPSGDKPIIVDMATSEIPFFELLDAKKNNKKMRPNSAVDSEGNITTNPKKVLLEGENASLLPMGGGYKGYALVLLLEILTGSLVRSLLSIDMDQDKYLPEEHGALLIAIDVASFTQVDNFKAEVERLANKIRNLNSAPKVKRVLVPGDASYERYSKIMRSGKIELDKDLLARLKSA